MNRTEILKKGIELTSEDRQAIYGDAKGNMQCYAALLDAYIQGKAESTVKTGTHAPHTIHPVDAAMFMVLAKVSRVAFGQYGHEDNYIDGATYFAIAGECASPPKLEDVDPGDASYHGKMKPKRKSK